MRPRSLQGGCKEQGGDKQQHRRGQQSWGLHPVPVPARDAHSPTEVPEESSAPEPEQLVKLLSVTQAAPRPWLSWGQDRVGLVLEGTPILRQPGCQGTDNSYHHPLEDAQTP